MVDLKKAIIQYLEQNEAASSRAIFDSIKVSTSFATVKRKLVELIDQQILTKTGNGKATLYFINQQFEYLRTIDVDHYFLKEIDERKIYSGFNFSILYKDFLNIDLFSNQENEKLNDLQERYKTKAAELDYTEYSKELERLAIDLSWKSSQIEGNTYSLLETERLIKENETASGKTKDEAQMLLNHKSALDFIISNPNYLTPLSISSIEDIHTILTKNLNIKKNIRKKRVAITGTNYTPLDNEFQIKEALNVMCDLINKKNNVFEKSLLILIFISYIQAFNDGNKRTARIISNAILIDNNYCPISFRTVDSIDYKKAMLIFYEKNNISAFKKIFIEQFEFAVKTYF